MERVLHTYVDKKFLLRLFESYKDSPNFTDEKRLLEDVIEFIEKDSKVTVISDKSILENGLIEKILLGVGDSTPKFVSDISAGIEGWESLNPDSHPRSLFLIQEESFPIEEIRTNCGVAAYRVEDIADHWPNIFRSSLLDVSNGVEQGALWSKMMKKTSPINSVLIADKFLYSQFISSVDDTRKENVFSLLDSIVSGNNMESDFHVYILTDIRSLVSQERTNPRIIYNELKSFLQKEFPNKKFEVSVSGYESTNPGHKDRWIVTNYSWIKSSDSFDVFYKKDSGTTLHYHPMRRTEYSGEPNQPDIMRRFERAVELFNTEEEVAGRVEGELRTFPLSFGDHVHRLCD